ncbi:protoheme IX farnesyltransferase [Rheinheimera sp. SA_1]|uniref:heme o synthase n=1 Tax=Rheinheimera sp. SA_1 TaxID=1827365 RepID=UPI000801E2AA|nr:heme o synthase [Rheinheimera sp. SA_1]OBP13245.1 protoheme IX farnesyltransferase [Rheinheimera sp. SA_1]
MAQTKLAVFSGWSQVWRDYYQLTKPKVVALLLLTAWVGMMLAQPGLPALDVLVVSMIGIGLLSSAAAALNHVLDQRIDAQMARTHHRPVARGRISTERAVVFSLLLAASGFVVLYAAVNPLTAWLTLASLFGYAVVYTMYLKRATPQNIVIGGLAGAMPPLLGWTAMTGQIAAEPLLLVMIIFAWTPPHFWALAIHRRDDYAKVNMPMLPVTHGIEFTKTAIFLYTLILFLVCLMPYLVGMTGAIYLVGTVLLNLWFMGYAWQLKFHAKADTAIKTFRFSIVHLMLLFLLLLVDHYLKWTAF